MFAGLVLAAGEGRRMGGPKALLRVDGAPLALLHAQRFLEAGCAEVVVVTRPEVVPALPALPPGAQVLAVRTRSQAESLAAGLRATAANRLLITPVDLLPPSEATLRVLMDALQRFGAASPRVADRGGHPVAIHRRWLSTFERPVPELTLHEALRAMGAHRARIDVDDRRVLGDFDRPDALLDPEV